MKSITRYLERRLRLTVHPVKSKVVKATDAEFLSFTFTGEENPVVEEEPAAFQAENPQTDQPQLGSVDGTSPEQTGRIYPGLDGLFQDNRILPAHTATGSMDTSAYPLLFY